MADILAGQALLTEQTLRSLFVRIGRSLAKIYADRRRPRQDTTQLIEWRPREYNKVADYLCNAAMDQKQSSEFADREKIEEAHVRRHQNFQLQSDGGLRQGRCGAIGWTLYSVANCGGEWLWTKIAWKTQYLEDPGGRRFVVVFANRGHGIGGRSQFLSQTYSRSNMISAVSGSIE